MVVVQPAKKTYVYYVRIVTPTADTADCSLLLGNPLYLVVVKFLCEWYAICISIGSVRRNTNALETAMTTYRYSFICDDCGAHVDCAVHDYATGKDQCIDCCFAEIDEKEEADRLANIQYPREQERRMV